jgi:hypothetical protein
VERLCVVMVVLAVLWVLAEIVFFVSGKSVLLCWFFVVVMVLDFFCFSV